MVSENETRAFLAVISACTGALLIILLFLFLDFQSGMDITEGKVFTINDARYSCSKISELKWIGVNK